MSGMKLQQNPNRIQDINTTPDYGTCPVDDQSAQETSLQPQSKQPPVDTVIREERSIMDSIREAGASASHRVNSLWSSPMARTDSVAEGSSHLQPDHKVFNVFDAMLDEGLKAYREPVQEVAAFAFAQLGNIADIAEVATDAVDTVQDARELVREIGESGLGHLLMDLGKLDME